jgi:hypothetical protein
MTALNWSGISKCYYQTPEGNVEMKNFQTIYSERDIPFVKK